MLNYFIPAAKKAEHKIYEIKLQYARTQHKTEIEFDIHRTQAIEFNRNW